MLNFIIVKLYNYARKDSLQTRFEIKFVVTIVLGGIARLKEEILLLNGLPNIN